MRSQLLPKLGVLAVLDLVSSFLPKNAIILIIGFIVIIAYVAYVLLSTRDVIHVGDFGRADRFTFQWSGPLAVAVALALILIAVLSMGTPVEKSWISSRTGLFTVKYLTEVGLILAVACWCTSPVVRHVRPIALWRIFVLPLILIYGLYVTLIPVSQFAGDCDQRSNERQEPAGQMLR